MSSTGSFGVIKPFLLPFSVLGPSVKSLVKKTFGVGLCGALNEGGQDAGAEMWVHQRFTAACRAWLEALLLEIVR
jgi:hypothetical protein